MVRVTLSGHCRPLFFRKESSGHVAVSRPADTRYVTSIGTLHWGFLPALATLSILHYLFCALALQTAAARRLPLREATMTQFTAAAASRITPGGLGAPAVNIRYLTVRGMTAPQAVASVAALQAVTTLGDLTLFISVLAIGAATGAGGGVQVLVSLGTQCLNAVADLPLPWLAAVCCAVGVLIAYYWRRQSSSRIVRGGRETLAALRTILRRPWALLLTLFICAMTTFLLGVAFAISVLAIPGASSPTATITLISAYLIGATAGAAVPVPSGIGSTEAALVAALGGAGVHPVHAIKAVVLFRLITFWLPIPFGIVAGKSLRRRKTRPNASAVEVPTAEALSQAPEPAL